jgi:hypothetical protein
MVIDKIHIQPSKHSVVPAPQKEKPCKKNRPLALFALLAATACSAQGDKSKRPSPAAQLRVIWAAAKDQD